jgi:YHS domain-containing protein
VVVKTTAGWASDNTTVVAVVAPTHDGSNQTDPVVKPQIDNRTSPDYTYDYYGGLWLFSEGIHVLATEQDPRTLYEEFNLTDAYWKMLSEAEATHATDQDFISIILSRGDKTSGGYNIQIENFGWLESYPRKISFPRQFHRSRRRDNSY